ncbi:hypothetical protein [Clostridium pasteurianum]|uniref:hypothetical protein n=1 Tax=Clostridium pasteurianum TaxID=1501 RepID=UPI001A99C77B|nr:hypothetical protein [Clostridium pasteurianum]
MIKRIYKCGLTIFAKNWGEMKEKKQNKFNDILIKKANKFYKVMKKRKHIHTRIFTKLLFTLMKIMISKFPDDNSDKIYWKEKGWI